MTNSLTIVLLARETDERLERFLTSFERYQPVDEFKLVTVDDFSVLPKQITSTFIAMMTPNVLLRDGWFKKLQQFLEANTNVDAARPSTILSNGAVCTDVNAVLLIKSAAISESANLATGTPNSYEFTDVISKLDLKVECDLDTRVDAFGEFNDLLLRSTFQRPNNLVAERTGPLPFDIDDFVRNNPNTFTTGIHAAGRCNICGEAAAFEVTSRQVSYREQLICSSCRSTSRYRSLARGILKAIYDLTGVKANSLEDLPKSCTAKISIYDTQVPYYYGIAYPIPDVLKKYDWIDIHSSVYLPDIALGEVVGDGQTNQNLEKLTFADNSFDIVITSEVMEHVRNYKEAHQEVARVLKPGGVYLFTVPSSMNMEKTLIQVVVHDPDDPSKDEIIGEPEYHGTATPEEEPPLSYRVYGRDLLTMLESLGFSVTHTEDDFPGNAILETELFYCRLAS